MLMDILKSAIAVAIADFFAEEIAGIGQSRDREKN